MRRISEGRANSISRHVLALLTSHKANTWVELLRYLVLGQMHSPGSSSVLADENVLQHVRPARGREVEHDTKRYEQTHGVEQQHRHIQRHVDRPHDATCELGEMNHCNSPNSRVLDDLLTARTKKILKSLFVLIPTVTMQIYFKACQLMLLLNCAVNERK